MGFKDSLNSLTVGLGFLVGYLVLGVLLRGNHWLVAQSNVSGQFGAVPRSRHIDGNLHVTIGLQQVDVTLTGKIENGSTSLFTYQESFPWTEDRAMVHHLRRGLRGGLPYPVLTVLEHLAAQEHVWGRKFAFYGRLVTLLLWLSFSSGVISAVLGFLGEERMLSAWLGITGCLVLVAVMVHDFLTPSSTLAIHFSRGRLIFTYGWCYLLLLYLGIASLTVSLLSTTFSHLERVTDHLTPVVSLIQKLDHYFQKHATELKTTA